MTTTLDAGVKAVPPGVTSPAAIGDSFAQMVKQDFARAAAASEQGTAAPAPVDPQDANAQLRKEIEALIGKTVPSEPHEPAPPSQEITATPPVQPPAEAAAAAAAATAELPAAEPLATRPPAAAEPAKPEALAAAPLRPMVQLPVPTEDDEVAAHFAAAEKIADEELAARLAAELPLPATAAMIAPPAPAGPEVASPAPAQAAPEPATEPAPAPAATTLPSATPPDAAAQPQAPEAPAAETLIEGTFAAVPAEAAGSQPAGKPANVAFRAVLAVLRQVDRPVADLSTSVKQIIGLAGALLLIGGAALMVVAYLH